MTKRQKKLETRRHIFRIRGPGGGELTTGVTILAGLGKEAGGARSWRGPTGPASVPAPEGCHCLRGKGWAQVGIGLCHV